MTNTSDLADDEMRAPTAEEVKFYAWRGPGYWGPRDQVNTDMVMMAREVERLREAADTIDRLTSTGEAVATQYRYWYSSGEAGVWLNERRDDADDLLESGVLIREDVRPLYTHASPREGHVEVPVEPWQNGERELCARWAAKHLADLRSDPSSNPDAQLWLERLVNVLSAALPHNQGETIP